MPTASALVPLWSRAAEWSRRLDMIAEARAFLYLTTFYVEHDDYGRPILAALLAAQRRGVRVQLVVDTFGQRLGGVLMTPAQRTALARDLDAIVSAGGSVRRYTPPRRLQRLLGGGQHVKIQVSEAGEALLGSGNLTRASFEGWNEYAVAVRGAIVPTLADSINAIGGAVEPAHQRHLAAQAAAAPGDLPLDYWFCNPNAHQGPAGPLGWRGANEVTERMIAMVEAARRSLVITSFYFKPVRPLLAAVMAAARRGVRVEVFHSHRDALPATDLAWIAAATSYPELLQAGVRLFENRRGEHSKIVLVDDEWAAFGSYNFEDAAHDRLAEAMLASRDPRAVGPIRAIVEGLRRDGDTVEVTAATLGDWPRRVRARVARYGRFKWWM